MIFFVRGSQLTIGVLTLCFAVSAGAQESLDSGKSGVQLFASDCVICHKSPQGLTKSGRLFGLDGFLREHYTASRESAGAIAAYLQAVDKGPAAPPPKAKRNAKDNTKGDAKGDGKSKGAEKKPAIKGSEPKASDPKPSDTKPLDVKPSEPKPSEPKASDTKPSEPEHKTSEPKPAQSPKAD